MPIAVHNARVVLRAARGFLIFILRYFFFQLISFVFFSFRDSGFEAITFDCFRVPYANDVYNRT